MSGPERGTPVRKFGLTPGGWDSELQPISADAHRVFPSLQGPWGSTSADSDGEKLHERVGFNTDAELVLVF